MVLTEKYRPRRLCDLVGQDPIRAALQSFCAKPGPAAFLFAGYTGVGKTSAALALAGELGCHIEAQELGGLYEIASGEQTADTVRGMIRSLSLRPFYGSGWKCLIVNEADQMSKQAECVWLDALERVPAFSVIIFTTNEPERLARRFRDRCEVYTFASAAADMRGAARALVAKIWQAETGQLSPPPIELGAVVEDGQLSLRRVVQFLTPLVRGAGAA